jgi:hypothetical protein
MNDTTTNTAPNTAPPAAAPKAPARPATNSADLSPQQRWQNDQDARSSGDPWLDASKVLTRDATGNLVQRERTVGADGEPRAGKPLDQPAADGETPDAAADGEAKRVKIGEIELTEAEWAELVAHKAESDLRTAQVPVSPGDYKLELPKDLKLPNGVQVRFGNPNDPNDPRGPSIRAFQDWAHKNGLSQGQFSSAMGIYAASQSHEQILVANAARAEVDKLGVSGPVRVDAISRFLRGHYGDAKARPMIAALATQAQVEIFEDLITRVSRQGGSPFNGGGRIPPDVPGKIPSGPEGDRIWNSMSYTAQKEYSERFSQG